MSKGIEVTCGHCHEKQDVTEAVGEMVFFGFKSHDVRRILHQYREAIPHYDDELRRQALYRDTGIQMLDLLTRIASTHPDCCVIMREIRQFLLRINVQGGQAQGGHP